MILSLDHLIFGNGYGFASPGSDTVFYWLSGELYKFEHGLGSQLVSIQWTRPRSTEQRVLGGYPFRPFTVHRRFGRVYITWATVLPTDINDAHRFLREMERRLARIA